MKKYLTKEMGINAFVTLVVVVGGLAIYHKFVASRINGTAKSTGGEIASSESVESED